MTLCAAIRCSGLANCSQNLFKKVRDLVWVRAIVLTTSTLAFFRLDYRMEPAALCIMHLHIMTKKIRAHLLCMSNLPYIITNTNSGDGGHMPYHSDPQWHRMSFPSTLWKGRTVNSTMAPQCIPPLSCLLPPSPHCPI